MLDHKLAEWKPQARAVQWLIVVGLALLWLRVSAATVHADELIVDDADSAVEVSGAWQSSATTPGFYGGGYLFHAPGHGSASVRWPFPAGAAPGTYAVYVRWTSGSNRAGTAVYRIEHASGASQAVVDQRRGGGQWHAAGTFTFQSGRGQGVSLAAESDGVVVADAVVFVGPVENADGADVMNLPTAQPLQHAVDEGDQPWRLDPLEVARADAVGLGFSPTDQMQLVERRDGAARVRAQRADATYSIELIQPARLGSSGIWTVRSIRRVSQ